MSTRSLIGKLNKDKTVSYAFCHWDGYPEYNGQILLKHYTDENKLTQLINFKNISSLGTTPYQCTANEIKNHKNREKDKDGFYVRCDFSTYPSSNEPYEASSIEKYMNVDGFQEYTYLFANKKWYVQNLTNDLDSSKFILLSDLIAQKQNPETLDLSKLKSNNKKRG